MKMGKKLAALLRKGDIVCLFGELGSGKTTFTKGIAVGLHIRKEAVNSPTFVLMNEYDGRLPLFHFDLYRLEETPEILSIGYEEFLYGDGVAVVEWAEKLKRLLPKEFIRVAFSVKKENERLIEFSALGARPKKILLKLKK